MVFVPMILEDGAVRHVAASAWRHEHLILLRFYIFTGFLLINNDDSLFPTPPLPTLTSFHDLVNRSPLCFRTSLSALRRSIESKEQIESEARCISKELSL